MPRSNMNERIMVVDKNIHKSNLNISVGIEMASNIDKTPTIDNMLNMLLPTIPATTILPCFLMEATIDVVNSGKEDPIATIPSPITSLLILNLSAIPMEPSKNKDDPMINNIIPARDNIADNGKLRLFAKPISDSTSSTSFLEKFFLS